MPCGCRAMLRLNYSWTENLLKITTLNHEHFGHDEEKIGPDLAKKPKIQVKNHPKSPKDENLPRNYANEAKNLHKNYANFSENSSSIGLADDFKSKNHPNQAKITPKNYANEANILPNLHSNYANLLQNRSSIGLIDKIQSKNYANVAKIAEILPKNYANELNILPNLHRNYANFPQIIDNLVSPTNTVLLLRQFLVKNNRSILSQPILEELRQSIINFPLNDDYADVEFQRALSDLKNLAAFYRSKKR
uniref:Uncharacterized protein n=1 Tax=Romanomermis culicivorax TaxID=13658 RepID=A0A915K953_ROMCU